VETGIVEAVKRALPLLLRYPQLACDYDREADVLYVTFERAEASDSDLTDDDIVVRYRDGQLIGVTVLHASTRVPALAAK
jgi:uncharacterized protein YuzE